MTIRPSISKYPRGYADHVRVKANKNYAAAHRQTLPNRQGTVTDPTAIANHVRVKWDGCAHSVQVDIRMLDLVN